MSMWSERKEYYEEQERNESLAKVGDQIRALPEHEQRKAMDVLENAGIDVSEAMQLTAKSRYDPHW